VRARAPSARPCTQSLAALRTGCIPASWWHQMHPEAAEVADRVRIGPRRRRADRDWVQI